MNTKLKVSGAGLLLVGSLLSMQASAVAVGACANGTVFPLGQQYSCTQGDKKYTFEAASTLASGFGSWLVDAGGIHTFTYTRTGTPPTGGTLLYTIEIIDDPATPGNEALTNFFALVDLSAAVTIAPVTVTKSFSYTGYGINELVLTSIDGSEPAGIPVAPNVKKLWVTDSLSLSGDGAWNSITNTFIQGTVSTPEPGSLALLGFALAGLGFVGRRKA